MVLGVIALVGAIVAWVTWHRGADERHSVQHHQHTLETLRHVADRRPPSVWHGPGRRSSTPKDRPDRRIPARHRRRRRGSGPVRRPCRGIGPGRRNVGGADGGVHRRRRPCPERPTRRRRSERPRSRRMALRRSPGAAERARRRRAGARASDQARRGVGGGRRRRCRRECIGAGRIAAIRRRATSQRAPTGRDRSPPPVRGVTDLQRRLVRPHRGRRHRVQRKLCGPVVGVYRHGPCLGAVLGDGDRPVDGQGGVDGHRRAGGVPVVSLSRAVWSSSSAPPPTPA